MCSRATIAAHVGRCVEAAVVVVPPRLALQLPGAAHHQARGAVELVDDRGDSGLLGVADGRRPAGAGRPASPPRGRADDDRAAGIAKTVRRLWSTRVQDVRPASRSSSSSARRAPCPAVTPSVRAVQRAYQDLRRGDRVEQRVSCWRRADPRERRRGRPREGGHALPRAARPRCGTGCRPRCDIGSNHSCSMAPCTRMCSSTPRTHPTRRPSGRTGQAVAERALLSVAAGPRARCWPARQLARVDLDGDVPVCSRVRPTRDCRPNSSTASNSRRRLHPRSTRAGTVAGRPCFARTARTRRVRRVRRHKR